MNWHPQRAFVKPTIAGNIVSGAWLLDPQYIHDWVGGASIIFVASFDNEAVREANEILEAGYQPGSYLHSLPIST